MDILVLLTTKTKSYEFKLNKIPTHKGANSYKIKEVKTTTTESPPAHKGTHSYKFKEAKQIQSYPPPTHKGANS